MGNGRPGDRAPDTIRVRQLRRSQKLDLDGPTGALSVTVVPELSGDRLDINDQSAVHSAGACLAHIHRVLGSVQHDPALASPHPAIIRERIEEWLATQDRGYAPDASRRLETLLSGLLELEDEPQLVHNDFRAANILIRHSQVVGVLDFDEVACEHRVSDLAKASVYLGTRFTNWRPIPPAARHMLRAGYESAWPLSPAEAHWFDVLVFVGHAIMAIPSESDTAGWACVL